MFKIKYLILLLVFGLLFNLIACNSNNNNNNNNNDLTESIYIKEDNLQDSYYIDEFNLTDFYVCYKIGDVVKSQTMILPTMCENYPDSLSVGDYTLKIKYHDLTCDFNIHLIEKEKYSSGLLFTLNNDNTYSIVGYNGTDKDVIIPNTYNNLDVTIISTEAFMNKEIDSVILSNNIISIEDQAFYNSTIKSISFNNKLETIGDYAFDECYNLRYVYLTKNITNIGINCFKQTNKILIESDTYPIGYNQSMYDINNSYIYFDIKKDNLININNSLYYQESNLLTLIDYYGESEEYNITNNINTNIGPYAFYNHEELKKINLSNNVKRIFTFAFKNSGLEEVILPDSILELGDYAFSYCLNLTYFKCNNGLKTIPVGCFSACGLLEEIYISNTIERIEGHAFQNCYVLNNTFIPKSVIYIGDGTFYMNKANNLYLEESTIPNTWDNNFNPSNRKIYYNQTRDE